MKLVVTVLLCLSLVACSTNKVHLYTRYLSVDEVDKISQSLTELDFDVITNTHPFPDDIYQSTLLYSPFLEGEGRIDQLVQTLDDLGWVIPSVQPLFSGNHSYTKNSAGLLLLPEGGLQPDKVAVQDLFNVYKANNCDEQVTLNLKSDNSYQLIYANQDADRQNHLNGSWRITHYPYIELVSSGQEWRFYLTIDKSTTTDRVSQIELIELNVVEKHHVFPNCNFAYGLRV
jgi:hypothetical protein